ncbi:hypothetical protein ZIOFF_057116 [Zingiber officinale]|uniref:Epidermal patterning factor-like protein n=1 Tax=Zingiber officinale TaxID=94328 RepID=A0A8J5F6Z6_ZINOF|nr:hypothetical protein ZIOFF_057116 [Zingiber officinale]
MGLLHSTNHLLLLLLLCSSTSLYNSVEGRSLSILPEIASGRGEGKVRALIGSRPPTCEKRCRTCSHCEAIQVPVITQKTKTRTKKESLDLASNLSGDFNSNYKPLSWKCKCGSIVFDP